VADDPLPPFQPSGIRLGTPAITTRGLKEKDMVTIAKWMKQAIDKGMIGQTKQVKRRSKSFCLAISAT